MEFWNKLSEALKQKGFRAQQIKKLEELFGSLDAAALLNLHPDEFLPAMTGSTVAGKRAKIETFLAVVQEVQAELGRELPIRSGNRSSFAVRLFEVDAPEKPPLQHFIATIELLNEDDKPVGLLFRGRSDARGLIPFTVAFPEGETAKKNVKLTVRGVDGQPVLEQTLKLDSKKPELTVDVKLADYRKKLSGPLDEWKRSTGRTIPAKLNDLFTREKVNSLADIRRSADTLLKETGLSRQEKVALDELFAHARLQVLSQDTALNQELIASGFNDLYSIAKLSRDSFKQKTKSGRFLSRPEVADRIHAQATSQVEALKNIALERRVARANGFSQAQTAADPQPCDCDCQSAVSPLAYLADLLDFVLREVAYNDGDLTLSQLEQFFHQPLSALPADCSSSEEILRQVRICIEVLHSKALAEGKATAAGQAVADHAGRACDALLSAMGTSSRELRLLRGASEEDRKSRAQSLGIGVDHLNDLLPGNNSQPFDEQALEALFGLQGTNRDPLSFGVKTADSNDRIRRWKLNGVAWKKNTSEDGLIIGSLVKQGSNFTLTLYKDNDRNQEVAKASGNWNTGSTQRRILMLSPQNGSNLNGSIEFRHDTGNWTTKFVLVAIPELLIWKFEELNRLWEAEDHPENIFQPERPLDDSDFQQEWPIIDPDMLTESHFCRPLAQNPAYGLWEERSGILTKKAQELSVAGNGTLHTLDEMIGFAWDGSVLKPEWDGTVTLLNDQDAALVEKGVKAVTELHLTVETFNFLNELRLREIAEADAADNGNPLPDPGESEQEERTRQRAMAVEILVNVVKRRDFYKDWLIKESDLGISLTQQFFCLPSFSSPLNYPLRVPQEQVTRWQQQLLQNSKIPILDPDVWHPVRQIGQSAGPVETLRLQRQTQLQEIHNELINLTAAQSNLQWLDGRLGGINLGQSGSIVLHALGFSDLNSLQEAFDNRQLEIQPQQHGLTQRELIALFTLRKLVAAGQADKQDWHNIFHILLQAEKRRYLYPAWRAEEEAEKLTLSPEYFRSPDLPLLKLLAGEDRPSELIEWRGDARMLREMRSKLIARFQQRAALAGDLSAVVDSAEEATLPALRDAMIDVLYADPNGSKREQNKREASNTLLINTFESGCRKTTRVAQAIETMQLLVWGIINRQIEDFKFAIPAENQDAFEAAWHWLQSYASWRSAVFVYLYPENILLPLLYQSDSIVFNVVRKIMSGELGPARGGNTGTDGESSETDGENSEASNQSDVEKQIVESVFNGLGDLSPASLKGVRNVLYRMLHLRLYDDTSTNVSSGNKNPYFDNYAFYEGYVANNPGAGFPDLVKSILSATSQYNQLVNPIRHIQYPMIWYSTWPDKKHELEDMYLLPLHGALILQQNGQFEGALEMYRWVFDFQKMDFRFGRVKELLAARQGSFAAYEEWLYQDRLAPHALAKTRTDADLRFILMSVIRCHLEYAEAEFSADSPESLGRARELYFTARRLLEHESLKQTLPDCEGSIGQFIRKIVEKYRETDVNIFWNDIYNSVVSVILDAEIPGRPELIDNPGVWETIRNGVDIIANRNLAGTGPLPEPGQIQGEIRQLFEASILTSPTPDLGTRYTRIEAKQSDILHDTLQDERAFEFAQAIQYGFQQIGTRTAGSHMLYSTPGFSMATATLHLYIPGVFFEFCIPPNPLLIGLRLRAEIGLYKLSNCMNMAGMRREVPVYAAPTDTSSGLPVAGNNGTLTLPGTIRLQSTQYRYKILVERARQLVGVAQQLESSYLSSLEKFDQETYTILRARHDLDISKAQVTLQGLRLTEASTGIQQAQQQWEKVDFQEQYYAGLIEAGLSGFETAGLTLLGISGGLQAAAAAGYFLLAGPQVALGIAGGATTLAGGAVSAVGAVAGIASAAPTVGWGLVAGLAAYAGGIVGMHAGVIGMGAALITGGQTVLSGVQATAGATSTFSSLLMQLASFERRQKEWELQNRLMGFDKEIADLQRTMARDRYNIVQQEQTIARLGADNAADVVNFLNNKFTTAELYYWMSGIVGEAYRYFLEQATAMARMAQMQLAFERQEIGLDHILNNYWSVTSAGISGGADSDRRGLTGSVRLLQDLTQLDQHAFTTDKRKLQMSRTISLALHDPIEFQLFKMTGVLPFATTHELFDRDFPGHYLRLIKRVRTTVIALVPPTQGIKATLSHSGISYAMVSSEGGASFEERKVQREPESVALTSPANDSGVFEMQEQSEMLLPFEGLGVMSGGWEFRMPHAANAFNYGSIADILITIEYTALDSPTYRQQVIKDLDRNISADRPFSFRHQFADAWYDLHHPDLVQDPQQPMAVSFTTRREDFPPNVSFLEIKQVTLYIALKSGASGEIKTLNLHFLQGEAGAVTGSANLVNGITKLASMNGRSPIGEWTLVIEDTPQNRKLFEDDLIEDILFVITFGGETAAWQVPHED